MRKHFLILMLLALLPLTSWAQFAENNYVPKGDFIYKITQAAAGETPGKVVLYGIRDGRNPVDANKALNLEGKITIGIIDGPSFDFVVDYALADALKKTYTFTNYTTEPTEAGVFAGMTVAESVVIPKEFLTIKANTFYGYTNMKTISFEANSEVTTIESGAFNTTQIRTFDFSNCSKLTAIAEGLFVQPDPATNSYVELIILPENSEALTSIGTAFQRLTNLSEIRNLDKSLITKVVADAFKGDISLENLALPGTVEKIAANAFRGSGIENLTIDVTSLDNPDGAVDPENLDPKGNVYGAGDDLSTLRSLTLKGVLSGEFKPEAFKGCDELTTVDMTNMTITAGTIGASAFEGCVRLASLTFNDITEGTIGANAFKGCSKLLSVTFGNITGTELVDALIDDSAFENCPKLGVITFGNLEYVTIDQSAFKKASDTSAASTDYPNLALSFGTLTDVDINASAFEGCSKLTSISFGAADHLNIASKAFAGSATNAAATLTFNNLKDVVIAGTATGTGAFYNTTKLSQIKFAALENQTIENLDIQTYAFENTASALSTANGTLTFGNAKNITIGEAAFKGADDLQTITFGDIEDDATASVEIAASAFENTTGLKTLTFGTLTDVTIKGDAFKAATSGLTGTNVASATFGNLVNTEIEKAAFNGATKLQTVEIGNISGTSVLGSNAAVFGTALKTVTIGNVEGAAKVIMPAAFTFGNVSGASLTVGALKVLSGANPLIDAGAFNLSAVDGSVGAPYVAPVVTIGALMTTNTIAAKALVGDEIAKITFGGNIVAEGLNNMIIIDNADAVADLELSELVFNGEIATGGIVANAFAGLPEYMTITFNGKLAAGAIAAGAFEGLKGQDPLPAGSTHSRINYTYNGSDIDLTVNPFAKRAFDNTSDITAATTIAEIDAILKRQIQLSITNEALAAKFFGGAAGLGTDGTFEIYRVIVEMPAPPAPDDFTFLVYPQLYASATTAASPRTAWARWELGARKAEGGTLAAGTNLVIKRVQKIDGTNNAKITIYGTYTDEDDALNLASVYMVPLKAENGYYHIPGTNKTTLIVKVENNGADFTETSYKVECNHDDAVAELDWPAYNANVCTDVAAAANGSIWPGLVNKELYVASNIMTNQQLIDNLAVDAANATDATGVYGYYHAENVIDIYRGGTAVAEDLYIMSDPSNNKGFRIAKSEITSTNNAYINTGWYYMLLKKYEGAAAAAHVVWMDDATEGEITGILTVKDNAKNVAAKSEGIYTLQGVRVSEMQKGQIYIVNGKKYIAK